MNIAVCACQNNNNKKDINFFKKQEQSTILSLTQYSRAQGLGENVAGKEEVQKWKAEALPEYNQTTRIPC